MLNSINLLSPLQVLLGLALGCLNSFFTWNQFLIFLAASYQLVKLRLFPAWHCWRLCFLPCFLFLWACQWTNKRALTAEHTLFLYYSRAQIACIVLSTGQILWRRLSLLDKTWMFNGNLMNTFGGVGVMGLRREISSICSCYPIVYATGQVFSQIWHLYGFYQVYC